MTVTTVTEKREKSLGEILIVIVVVALLMMTFIFYFFKHQQQLVETGFESIASVFSARVNAIRGQWFMENQPDFVSVSEYQTEGKGELSLIPVNNSGWVDIENKALACQKIWLYVMESPLNYMKNSISAIRIETSSGKRYCQYSLENGVYFTYQSQSGVVSDVMKNK